MRIEGPRGTNPLNKSEKTRKSGSTGGGFGELLSEGAESAQGAAPSMAARGVGALLAAQYEDEDAQEKQRRKQMLRRAGHVLDTLDAIQKGLVQGNISLHDMNRIKGAVATRREGVSDPKLLEIMDEVDMRAQIELAKLEMAREKQGRY